MVLGQHPSITMSSRLLGNSPAPTTAPSDDTKQGDSLTHRSDPAVHMAEERAVTLQEEKLRSDNGLGREQQVAECTPGQSLVPTSWRQVSPGPSLGAALPWHWHVTLLSSSS